MLFVCSAVLGTGILVLSAGDMEHESSTNKPLFYSGIAVAGITYLWSLIDAPVSASRINKEKRIGTHKNNLEVNIIFLPNQIGGNLKYFF